MEDVPIIVPHEDYGDPECCGCIMRVVRYGLPDLTLRSTRVLLATEKGELDSPQPALLSLNAAD